jgi:two-component sensor histidine kinase
VKAFQSKSLDQFEIAGDNIAVSSRPAISLSMLIHELCTNAVKYGVLSAPNGRVSVSCPKIIRRGSSCIGKSTVALLSKSLFERASVLDL